MKIKVEIEIREETVKRIKRLGETPYKEVKDVESRWWNLRERIIGGLVIIKIGKGEYEEVK